MSLAIVLIALLSFGMCIGGGHAAPVRTGQQFNLEPNWAVELSDSRSTHAVPEAASMASVKTGDISPTHKELGARYVNPTETGTRIQGDTVADPFPVGPLPFTGIGTTAGFVNNYDEVCQYSGSTAPDVVYAYVADGTVSAIEVDLCHSSYDTKVYVYVDNPPSAVVACNDDYYVAAPCYTYSSFVGPVFLVAGHTYYIVVDGYGGESGPYQVDITDSGIVSNTVVVEADGSGDFPTIQAAVDAVPAGWVVELGDGVFRGDGNWNATVHGRPLTIRSRSGDPERCIIDCQGGGWGLYFDNVSAGGLSGVTITNGVGAHPGTFDFAGFACGNSSITIDRCRFLHNLSWGCAGVLLSGSNATVRDCSFVDNAVLSIEGGSCFICSGLNTFERCTFYNNQGPVGRIYGPTTLDRTIIAFSTGGGAMGGYAPDLVATCCDVFGNAGGPGLLAPLIGQDGNIAEDPLFCDAANGDLTLGQGSPCLSEHNPTCGQIGAWPLGCVSTLASFVAAPVLGRPPLAVQFTDRTEGDPDGWEWDFDNDGEIDATTQHPYYTYALPGTYSVHLSTFVGGQLHATLLRENYVHALTGDNLILHAGTITSDAQAVIPIQYDGTSALGAISVFFQFDPTKVSYAGVQSLVPGETFLGGVVGDRVSIQWYDETGGLDPIVPGVDPDTLFAVLFEDEGTQGTTQLSFDKAESVLGDRFGDPLLNVHWIDDPPLGTITINLGAVVSGRVGYYWQDRAVPGAGLSMGMPGPDVVTDAQGGYVFPGYPFGNYVLQVEKSDDLGGINSLDAIKIVRHATGAEPLGNPHKMRAADVNRDGHINALDAFKVVLAALGLQPLPAGDWAFDPDSLSIAPLDVDRQVDFVAMRMGDANGDWAAGRGEALPNASQRARTTPGVTQLATLQATPAGSGEALLPTITLSLPDTTLNPQGGAAALPLRVTNFNSVGAVSLRITFADDVLHYVNVQSNVPGVSFSTNLIGSEIRIEWYDATGGSNPITMGSGKLLTINFQRIGAEGQLSPLVFDDMCALGDPEGDPITGVEYIDGMCRLFDASSIDERDGRAPKTLMFHSGLPNPFRPETVLTYSLPKGAHVDLAVFDIEGRSVVTLIDSDQGAGVHHVAWDGRDDRGSQVSSGVYVARLRVGGSSRILKLVRCR